MDKPACPGCKSADVKLRGIKVGSGERTTAGSVEWDMPTEARLKWYCEQCSHEFETPLAERSPEE